MYKHKWKEVDSGFGVRCVKCHAYTSKLFDNEFSKTKSKENCTIPDKDNELSAINYYFSK